MKQFLFRMMIVVMMMIVCFGFSYLLASLEVSLGWSIFWAFVINIVLLVNALLLSDISRSKAAWIGWTQSIMLACIIFNIGLMCWNAFLMNDIVYSAKLRPAEVSEIPKLKYSDNKYFRLPGMQPDEASQIKSVEVTESNSGKKSYTAEYFIPLKNDSIYFPGKTVKLWLYDLRTSSNRSFGDFDDDDKMNSDDYAYRLSEYNSNTEKTFDVKASSEAMGYANALIIEFHDLNGTAKNKKWLLIAHGIYFVIAALIAFLQRKSK